MPCRLQTELPQLRGASPTKYAWGVPVRHGMKIIANVRNSLHSQRTSSHPTLANSTSWTKRLLVATTARAGLLRRRCRRGAPLLAALPLPEGRDRLGQVDDHRGDVVAVVPLHLRPADDRAHDQQVRGVGRGHAQLLRARDDAHRLAAVDELPDAVGSEDEEEVLRRDRARARAGRRQEAALGRVGVAQP